MDMIQVKFFPGKGRGIVATKLITKETKIEIAPVASVPAKQIPLIDKTDLFPYYFVIASEYQKNDDLDGHIVFGLSSLCNHSETPNAYINWIRNEMGLWAHLIALKDIHPGDEVCLLYANIEKYHRASEFL